jgi:hypothetical protein
VAQREREREIVWHKNKKEKRERERMCVQESQTLCSGFDIDI